MLRETGADDAQGTRELPEHDCPSGRPPPVRSWAEESFKCSIYDAGTAQALDGFGDETDAETGADQTDGSLHFGGFLRQTRLKAGGSACGQHHISESRLLAAGKQNKLLRGEIPKRHRRST